MFNQSSDDGQTWEGEQRITNTQAWSYFPWIFNNNSTIHVVWYEDDTIGVNSLDIYYLKYTPDSSNIIGAGSPSPSLYKISAYPNPFNSTLSINVSDDESGSLYITDILGHFITELKYPRGKSSIKWKAMDKDGKPIPSGAYFIKQKGSTCKDILKVMYLK